MKLQKRFSFDKSKVKNEFAKNFFKYKSQKIFWREYAKMILKMKNEVAKTFFIGQKQSKK